MRVLTLTPTEIARRVAATLGRSATVDAARDVRHLLLELEDAVPAVLVVDPRLIPAKEAAGFARSVRLAGVPLIAHTALTPLAMRSLLAISDAGVQEVFIHGVDDDAASVRRVFDRVARETLGGRVLSHISPALSVMPPPLRAAVSSTFVQPDPADTPHRLALRAGITRRSLDRWVARSGVASTRLLVAAPKIIMLYAQLHRGGASVASLAARIGHSSPRSLDQQCQALLNVRLTALREYPEPQAFVQAVAHGLLTHRSAPSAPGARSTSEPTPQ